MSDENNENSICNHPIQGTGAEGFKMVLVEYDRELSVRMPRLSISSMMR